MLLSLIHGQVCLGPTKRRDESERIISLRRLVTSLKAKLKHYEDEMEYDAVGSCDEAAGQKLLSSPVPYAQRISRLSKPRERDGYSPLR